MCLCSTRPPPPRPCKGVAKAYEKLAATYNKAVFLKLLGNANMGCKRLFKEFKIRSTPSFLFFRNGEEGGGDRGRQLFLRSGMCVCGVGGPVGLLQRCVRVGGGVFFHKSEERGMGGLWGRWQDR